MKNYEIAFAAVKEVTGVSKAEILSLSRVLPISEARMFIVLLLHRNGSRGVEIAKLLGRSSAAVSVALRRAIRFEGYSRVIKDKYNKISNIYESRIANSNKE